MNLIDYDKEFKMQELSELIESARQDFAQAEQPAALEDAKAKYIGKSGAVTTLMKSLGQLAPEERRARGQEINKAKAAIEAALNARREQLAQAAMQAKPIPESPEEPSAFEFHPNEAE